MKDSTVLDHFIVKAVSYDDLSSNRRVINKSCISKILHVELPTEIVSHGYILDEISCIDDSSSIEYLNTQSLGKPVLNHPWIDIGIGNINIDSGAHTYRIQFLNSKDNDIIFLYFSYIVQDDNPDKPYIYMNRK